MCSLLHIFLQFSRNKQCTRKRICNHTPVHLVESVENCGLCTRGYLSCSSYANVMHRELAITHWLPVRYRIMYKILILTYKCIHGFAPLYLQELIQEYKPTRNLRSSSKLNLISATVSTLTYGHRSFYKASAELWNNLPMHVKSCQTVSLFKSSLKTHLFKVAFDD